MKIKEVEVSIGRTVSTGDFESLGANVGMKADIDENENPETVIDEMRARLE